MEKVHYLLSRGEKIDSYTVTFPIQKEIFSETYRVKNETGENRILKLFDNSKLMSHNFTGSHELLEGSILEKIQHPNIVKYRSEGESIISGRRFSYIILDFVSGELLSEKLKREIYFNIYEVKDVILNVLAALDYLHNLEQPILYNGISNTSIMLDLSGGEQKAILSNFSNARYSSHPSNDFSFNSLIPFYLSNEALNSEFTFKSDLYSVGVLLYHLVEGLPPWFIDISGFTNGSDALREMIMIERRKKLAFNECQDQFLQNIIIKALSNDKESQFRSANQFSKALKGELQIELSKSNKDHDSIKSIEVKKKGGGFSEVAGMESLKKTIQVDIIDALNNQEKYKKYRLSIPNGLLLYGPPGCGKTFFAEKLSEEVGFNFYKIKPSDIQSKWVNASQENIKNLFEEAKEKSPSIIFIDELDAIIPNRDNSQVSHMNTSIVNEFLAQMNNCGEDGIFIIGATNKPNFIDSAILRAGRLDKHIYIAPPDYEARIEMFKLHLKNRPLEVGIDYKKIAKLTRNYVASDIKFLCDEAARAALMNDKQISISILIETINKNKPSVSSEELHSYKLMKDKIEGKINNLTKRPKIGF